MATNDFTGMRKVTIRTSGGTFEVFTPDKIGADGFTTALETNELTISSFAGDITSPNGTNIPATTLSLIPANVGDLGKIWPGGWDETTGSWQPPIGGCASEVVTLAWEKVCDTKGNAILRNAQIGLSGEFSNTRDDAMILEVTIYPSLSPGSDYGLGGNKATQMFAFQWYDGIYDPTTDTIAFDAEQS